MGCPSRAIAQCPCFNKGGPNILNIALTQGFKKYHVYGKKVLCFNFLYKTLHISGLALSQIEIEKIVKNECGTCEGRKIII